MTDTIRILIADDHPIVREGLRGLLATEPGMEVVGEAADGDQAVQMAAALLPDVVLLDLVMPRKDGITAIAEIREACPATRILVLTSFAEDEKLFPAIKSGALGYLLKDTAPRQLLAAIREVARGETPLHPAVARRVITRLSRSTDTSKQETELSTRELEVLTLVARGLSNQDIADQLCLSERTIRGHVSRILAKLHVTNRTQAALTVFRETAGH